MEPFVTAAPVGAETSRRITSLRFLLAVLVVFIHNNYTAESVAEIAAAGGTDIVFNQSPFGAWVQLLVSQGIARAAVPLFFLFAAYLQARKGEPYVVLLKKRARSLALPFVLWTALYLLYPHGVKVLLARVMPGLLAHPDDTMRSWSATDWLHRLFGYAVEADGGLSLPGIAYHLWFIRDLLILTLLSPLLRLLARRVPAGLFALCAAVYLRPAFVYVVETQALFFYVAGLLCGEYDFPLFSHADRIGWAESLVLFVLAFVAANCGDGDRFAYWCMVLCACVLALKLSGVIVRRERLFACAKYLSGVSFFLYCVHTPVLNGTVARTWICLFPMRNTFFCLAEYFGATALTVAFGTGLGLALRKICPRLFRLLSGGRQ